MTVRSRKLRHGVRAMALVLLASPGLAQAGAQTFNTALPVADGNFDFREQFLYRQASEDSSPVNRDLGVAGAVSVLGYGVTGDLTSFGVVPYLAKALELDAPGGQRIKRDSTGFGDARAFARYTVFHDEAPGRTFRVAPFVRLEVPSGDGDERDRFGRLPQSLQPGSSSWDPFGGLILTYQRLDYELDAQIAHRAISEANGFERGDVARLDGSIQ